MGTMWKDVAVVLPLVCGVSALGYALYLKFQLCKKKDKSRVNTKVDQDCPKVVHSFDIEDLGTKAVFCRCWKSEKFPYCDGTHSKHNELTGDNVGPLILKHKDA